MISKIQVKNHLLFIDSLRAIAAIYVVIHHAVLQYYDDHFYPFKSINDYNLPVLKIIVLKLSLFGNVAVDLFIVVSGFSLMLSVTKNKHKLKGGILQFFKRRIVRILPPYYFATLFSLLMIWLFVGTKTQSHWDSSLPVSFRDVITHLFLIHDFFISSTSRINHAFWSIAVECRVYIFFPLLVLIWRKFGIISTIIFSVLVSVAGPIILHYLKLANPDIQQGTGVSPYILLFTFGMLAADMSFADTNEARYFRKSYYKVPPVMIAFLVIGMLMVASGTKHYFTLSNNPLLTETNLADKFYDVLFGLAFASILFICSIPTKVNNTFWLTKMLSWKPLIFVGSFSFSLYLIHAPLVALISEYVIAPMHIDRFASVMLLIIAGTPVIIFVSYGFFYVFERPFLTMGKKAKPETIEIVETEVVVNPAP